MRQLGLKSIFYDLKILFLTSIFLMTLSCSHKEIVSDLEYNQPQYQDEFDFTQANKTKRQLEIIGDLKNRKNQHKLVRLLSAFEMHKNQNQGEVTLNPSSKTQIEVITFCAASGKATPERNEVFHWIKGLPKTPLLKEVLKLFRNKPDLDRRLVQELIWNLENGTFYENYPSNMKVLLKQAAPSAPMILPSKLRAEFGALIIPDEIKKAASLIKGQYYSYDDFKNFSNKVRPNLPLSPNPVFSTLPDTNILVSILSNGYQSQLLSFYNPSNHVQTIAITDHYLKPLSNDVQLIVLASVLPHSPETQKLLEQEALTLLGYLGSQYPTLNREEKVLVKEQPIAAAIVFFNAILAEQQAEIFYPNSKFNDESDAFRHFAWSGLLTRDLGENRARIFLNAHESTPGQSEDEAAMDHFNNNQGIYVAKELLKKGSFDNFEIFERAKKEITAGKLRVLEK